VRNALKYVKQRQDGENIVLTVVLRIEEIVRPECGAIPVVIKILVIAGIKLIARRMTQTMYMNLMITVIAKEEKMGAPLDLNTNGRKVKKKRQWN